ncbi:MAG: hypothetical protein ACFCVA_16005, partial [Gammaproteobacteria bacterium]
LQTSSLAPAGLPDPILEGLRLLSMLQRYYLWYMELVIKRLKSLLDIDRLRAREQSTLAVRPT